MDIQQQHLLLNYMSLDLLLGKRVYVYYNLHKNTFSIKYKSNVVHWADYIEMVDVRFHVSNSAMLRILKHPQHKKEVHAYVIGTVQDIRSFDPQKNILEHTRPDDLSYKSLIRYNPLDGKPYFTNIDTKERIDCLNSVVLCNYYHSAHNKMKPTIFEPKKS